MRAAVFHEAHQPMTIETLEVAKPGAHEVLLNTAYAGLCHSDLHFLEGLYPIPTPVVLGHESSAVVEAVGSEVTYVKPVFRFFAAPANTAPPAGPTCAPMRR
jgi:S-(hydroxymethyl)glutathione dehydrogenase / alcohol dehydrogenase